MDDSETLEFLYCNSSDSEIDDQYDTHTSNQADTSLDHFDLNESMNTPKSSTTEYSSDNFQTDEDVQDFGQALSIVQSDAESTKSNATQAISENGQINERLRCEFCGYSAGHKNFLTRHIWVTHIGLNQCDVCEKRFSRKESLRGHMEAHRDILAVRCENCPHGFFQRKLTMEQAMRWKVKHFECYLCGKDFIGKFYLIDHMREHTGDELRCLRCRRPLMDEDINAND